MMPLLPQYYSLYQRIADKTDVNVIVSTGYYAEEKMPDNLRSMTELQMEDRMYKEVTDGFQGTKVKAGIIKIASNSVPLSDWERRVYRSAARVQKATGVPIGCHAWLGARVQLDILMQNGADPNHTNFAHIETEAGWEGRTIEQTAERLLTVVKDGGYILFNNFFQEFYTPWKDMVFLLRYFCDKGYANRIFTSMDTNWQWKDGKQVFEEEDCKDPVNAGKRKYAFFLTNGVPDMERAGFTKSEIETFLVQNPRNFFSI
jgi:phosphotriesterase-related protein